MKPILNFITRCYMAVYAIIPLLKVSIDGPRGGEWNSLYLNKMKREMFASLVAPVLYYTLFATSGIVMFTTKETFSGFCSCLTFVISFVFLYRIAPNVIAWGHIMRVVHTTARAAQSSGCMDQVRENVETELKRQGVAVIWKLSDKETPTSAVFNHSEWLARQLGFWKGERKSLLPEKRKYE
ncbi:MAG: hypothetical protein KBD47_00710 [Candidatus Pacebacteria bacterium]|nr:hypothetical protein [Candidatus Paceibacterota bacterium]